MKIRIGIIIFIIILTLFLILSVKILIDNNYNIKKDQIKNVIKTVAYANWASNFGGLASDKNCLNSNKISLSNERHLPIFKFETKAQLDEFKDKYEDVFTMDQGHDEMPSFNLVTSNYDEKFFETNTLILIYVDSSSGSFRYTIRDIESKNDNLIFYVSNISNQAAYTDDMSGWFLMAEFNKEYIKEFNQFDAKCD